MTEPKTFVMTHMHASRFAGDDPDGNKAELTFWCPRPGWTVGRKLRVTIEPVKSKRERKLEAITRWLNREDVWIPGALLDLLEAIVQEETVLRDCGQRGVCRTPPGCARHWEERNRELARENEVLHSNSDHLSSENASLSRQVESMAMRIESLAEELAKPEDVRLREALDALEGRAVIFDGLGARVGHLLDEMDEWIGRAGEAERMVEAARRSLSSVAESMTEHAYQELASALESPSEDP